MQRKFLRGMSLCASVFSLIFFSQTILLNAQLREFAGSYSVSNVSKSDQDVTLTLTVKLQNFTGSEIDNSTAVLYTSGVRNNAIGAFPVIKSFPNNKTAVVSETFTIPASEWALWHTGVKPTIMFLRPMEDGTHFERVDLQKAAGSVI